MYPSTVLEHEFGEKCDMWNNNEANNIIHKEMLSISLHIIIIYFIDAKLYNLMYIITELILSTLFIFEFY